MQAQPQSEDEPATTAGTRAIEHEVRFDGIESWRRDVLRGMLTVAAVIAPIVSLVALSSPSLQHSWRKIAMFIAAGLAFPALRLLPRPSVVARASAAIVLAFASGVLALTTFGFTSGAGVVLVATSVFAVIFLGRAQGLLFIVLSVAAFFVVGTLAARGTLPLLGMASDLDPHRMRNWTRAGISFAFLSILVTSAIDLVIRHVEASSRATSQALGRLRLAHEHLGQLHRRLDATEEEERRSLSRELHDELGQTLTALKLRLQLGEHAFRLNAGTGARVAGVDSLALVDDLISRVRKIAVDLRPPLLDEVGLVSALRVYLHAQASLSGSRSSSTPKSLLRTGIAACRPTSRSPASAWCRSRSPTRSAMPPPTGSRSGSPTPAIGCRCRSKTTAAASPRRSSTLPRPAATWASSG